MAIDKFGRPPKWNTPKELQVAIDKYYEWTKANNKHITVTGLAWWLGCDRKTLINYENSDTNGWLKECSKEDKADFIHTIKDAKRLIETEYEESLYDNRTTTGAIFTLKNNYAWCDKQEIVTTNNDDKLSKSEIDKQLEALGYADKDDTCS